MTFTLGMWLWYHVYMYSFIFVLFYFFFSSRRRHTRYIGDWSSDVCSSDLPHLVCLSHWLVIKDFLALCITRDRGYNKPILISGKPP